MQQTTNPSKGPNMNSTAWATLS
uniref:Uncharacterized protein n=1 Tax=Rhizophora mucronata TaxID=61149 RepID=A0A2P2PQ48_RHIMU